MNVEICFYNIMSYNFIYLYAVSASVCTCVKRAGGGAVNIREDKNENFLIMWFSNG